MHRGEAAAAEEGGESDAAQRGGEVDGADAEGGEGVAANLLDGGGQRDARGAAAVESVVADACHHIGRPFVFHRGGNYHGDGVLAAVAEFLARNNLDGIHTGDVVAQAVVDEAHGAERLLRRRRQQDCSAEEDG